jgi:hypothetical protein
MPDHGSNWPGLRRVARICVQQKHQDGRWRSLSVSAPGQAQTGQIGQKIVFRLEFADDTVQLGYFGIVIDLFLLPFAEEV